MLRRTLASAAVLSLLGVACSGTDDVPAINPEVSDGQDGDGQDTDGQDGDPDAQASSADPVDVDERTCPSDPAARYDPPPDEQPTPDPVLTTPEYVDDLDIGDDDGVEPDSMGAFSAARDWARSNASEHFAGMWIDPDHDEAAVIAFTDNVEQYAEDVREQFGESWWVIGADYTVAELDALNHYVRPVQDDLDGQVEPGRPGSIVGWGPSQTHNRVTISVVGGNDEALAQIAAELDDPGFCFSVSDPPPEVDPDGPVTTLATVSGWREGLDTMPSAYLEIAYDQETAARLIDENIPDDLNAGPEDEPWEDGVHGELDEVDLDTHVVAVWSSGRSGTCAEWINDITNSDDGVQVSTALPTAGDCTDDYNAYRAVIAVERDRLPTEDELPADLDLSYGAEPNAVITYGTDEDG